MGMCQDTAQTFSIIYILTLELHISALEWPKQKCTNEQHQTKLLQQVFLSFIFQYATDYKMVAVGNDTNGTTLYQKVWMVTAGKK